MNRIITGTTPAGPYSPGVLANGPTIYVSGQGPLRGGQLVPGTIEEETRLALENVAAVLASAGATLDDVVRCGVFVADLDDLPGLNRAYGEVFGSAPPARTTIGALLPGFKVEIDCIAVPQRTE